MDFGSQGQPERNLYERTWLVIVRRWLKRFLQESMHAPNPRAQRLITVAASTLAALACGTNYAYSAWAPQFREKMKFSATDINIIGTAANIGTYASGIPVGLLVDSKGPRPGALLGAVALFAGYFPIYRAYVAGKGSMGVPALFFFSFLTGFGGCSAFAAAIKTSASNFPHHRGSATAFPLAAFGLSAFFFSTLSAVAFRESTGDFLLVLAIGTSCMALVSTAFLRLIPSPSSYTSVPSNEPILPSTTGRLLRRESAQDRRQPVSEPGTQQDFPTSSSPRTGSPSPPTGNVRAEHHCPDITAEEASVVIAEDLNTFSTPVEHNNEDDDDDAPYEPQHNSLYADVRGFALLEKIEFWQLFLLMGILTGIGLMTINNIGNDVRALWKYYDDSVGPGFLQHRQAVHVSTISMLSFAARLVSGIGSDVLIKKFNMSRLWCLFASSLLFCISQFAGSQISNPHHLIFVSSITGVAYGVLFGVFPSLVSHTFGIDGLSQNWGVMTLAAVLGGYVFNFLYGSIYDRNSVVSDDGERDCREGLECYSPAYFITFCAGLVAAFITLWSIWHEKRVIRMRQEEKQSRDRLA